jgi:hypothetical protein
MYDAYMATNINKILSCYQPCQFVKNHKRLGTISVPIIKAMM